MFIPNYGERYRNGERISTGFVESTVNYVVSKRMVKKQQMRWSQRGAHLLLQIRTHVLNGDWEDVFRRWYPVLPGVHAPRGSLRTATSPRPSWGMPQDPGGTPIRQYDVSPTWHVSLFRVYFSGAC